MSGWQMYVGWAQSAAVLVGFLTLMGVSLYLSTK